MSGKKPIKIDPGLAAIVASVITVTGTALITGIDKSCTPGTCVPPSSDDPFISESNNTEDNFVSNNTSESSESNVSSEDVVTSETKDNDSSNSSDSSNQSSELINDSGVIDISSVSSGDPEPNSPSSDYESSTTPDSSVTEMPRTIEHYCAKAVLYNSNSGVAYIYREFLEENYIGKNIDNKYKLLGWTINFYADGQTLKFRVFPLQNDSYNVEVESNTFIDKNKILISAELMENGDLKISFDLRNNPIDLSSTYSFMPGTSVQEIAQQNSYVTNEV